MEKTLTSACHNIDDLKDTESLTVFTQHLLKIIQNSSDCLPDAVNFGLVVNNELLCQIGVELGQCVVRPTAQKYNDCEFHCSDQILAELCRGTLNPIRAFLDGRLLIYGDVGLALLLHRQFVKNTEENPKSE